MGNTIINIEDLDLRMEVAEAVVEMAERSIWAVQYFLTPEGLVKYQPFRWRGIPWKKGIPFLRLDEIIFTNDLYDLSPSVPNYLVLPPKAEEQDRVFRYYYENALSRALEVLPDTVVFLDRDPMAVFRQRITQQMKILEQILERRATDEDVVQYLRAGLRACAEFVAIQPVQFFDQQQFIPTLQRWYGYHKERATVLLNDERQAERCSYALAEAYDLAADIFYSIYSTIE